MTAATHPRPRNPQTDIAIRNARQFRAAYLGALWRSYARQATPVRTATGLRHA